MSDDLEKRLREAHEIEFSDEALRLMSRAADELARLRAENEALTVILNLCTEGTEWTYAQVPDELARLRAEKAALRLALRLALHDDPGTTKIFRALVERAYGIFTASGVLRVAEQNPESNDPIVSWASDVRSILYRNKPAEIDVALRAALKGAAK